MPHRQFTAGDTDYITRLNALANSLDRRLTQNILTNGSMQVWQRGTSFASAASRVLTADRWHFARAAFATGGTASRQTGSDPSRYCARVQRDSGNAVTGALFFYQPLTTENSYPLRGKRLGLRFRARKGADFSSTSSLLVVQVQTGTGTDQNPIVTYTGATNILNTSVTLTTSWQYFALDGGTVGGTATELSVIFVSTPVGTAGAADYFEIQEVQLTQTTDSNVDVGDYPWRSFEDELSECLTYYEKSFAYVTAPVQNAASNNGAAIAVQTVGAAASGFAHVTYQRRKRSSPTPTFYNPSAANALARNATRTNDWASTSITQGSEIGFVWQGTTSAGSAAGDLSYVHWTADAEL